MLVFILFISFSVSLSQTILLIDINTDKPIKNVNVFDGINGTTTDSLGLCNLENFHDFLEDQKGLNPTGEPAFLYVETTLKCYHNILFISNN